MKKETILVLLVFLLISISIKAHQRTITSGALCQTVIEMQKKTDLVASAQEAMLRATRFMVEKVSNNGGYVWQYLPDFSRQWGEMEAYKTMIWVQHPGTVSMGHLFLDAYKVIPF